MSGKRFILELLCEQGEYEGEYRGAVMVIDSLFQSGKLPMSFLPWWNRTALRVTTFPFVPPLERPYYTAGEEQYIAVFPERPKTIWLYRRSRRLGKASALRQLCGEYWECGLPMGDIAHQQLEEAIAASMSESHIAWLGHLDKVLPHLPQLHESWEAENCPDCTDNCDDCPAGVPEGQRGVWC